MWFVFALLSAVFAALTSILAKVGIEGVNSNLATAIRTMVVLAMAWGMVFVTNTQGGLTDISRKSWLFLILSGLATGASWLCYYRALQIGEASKVVPIDKLSVVITLVLAFVFLPKLLRGGIATIPEFFEMRYDTFTMRLFSLLFLIAYVVTMLPTILYSGAVALVKIFDLESMFGISYFSAITIICIGIIIV